MGREGTYGNHNLNRNIGSQSDNHFSCFQWCRSYRRPTISSVNCVLIIQYRYFCVDIQTLYILFKAKINELSISINIKF